MRVQTRETIQTSFWERLRTETILSDCVGHLDLKYKREQWRMQRDLLHVGMRKSPIPAALECMRKLGKLGKLDYKLIESMSARCAYQHPLHPDFFNFVCILGKSEVSIDHLCRILPEIALQFDAGGADCLVPNYHWAQADSAMRIMKRLCCAWLEFECRFIKAGKLPLDVLNACARRIV